MNEIDKYLVVGGGWQYDDNNATPRISVCWSSPRQCDHLLSCVNSAGLPLGQVGETPMFYCNTCGKSAHLYTSNFWDTRGGGGGMLVGNKAGWYKFLSMKGKRRETKLYSRYNLKLNI